MQRTLTEVQVQWIHTEVQMQWDYTEIQTGKRFADAAAQRPQMVPEMARTVLSLITEAVRTLS